LKRTVFLAHQLAWSLRCWRNAAIPFPIEVYQSRAWPSFMQNKAFEVLLGVLVQ